MMMRIASNLFSIDVSRVLFKHFHIWKIKIKKQNKMQKEPYMGQPN
jgi:hypothetical protein